MGSGPPQCRRWRRCLPLGVWQWRLRPARDGQHRGQARPDARRQAVQPVRKVAAGLEHTGIVTKACDLLMCGLGGNWQLGLADEFDRADLTTTRC